MADDATALAAGLEAAHRAQAIADAVNPPSLLDQVLGIPGTIARSVHDTIDDGLDAARDTSEQVRDVADTFLNVLKWIGIAILVLVGLMAIAWVAFAFFGIKTAAVILPQFAVGLGKGLGRSLAAG